MVDPLTVTLVSLVITAIVGIATLLIKSFFSNVKKSDCCFSHIIMKDSNDIKQ